jgi:hypothetical protein
VADLLRDSRDHILARDDARVARMGLQGIQR